LKIDLSKLGYPSPGRNNNRRRCTDRFVRYPYPSKMNSHYVKNFVEKKSLAKDHKVAFNLEKETKIINPHQMDMTTTMREIFKGKQAAPSPSFKPKQKVDKKPHAFITTNKINYPNW